MSIQYCGCPALTQAGRFQDERYGSGMRVHNPCKPKADEPRVHCVLCGQERAGPKREQS